MTMAGYPAVTGSKEIHNRRDSGDLPDRPRPPEAAANFEQSISAADNSAISPQQSHFSEKFGIRKT
jgi:hypothetical protein